MKFLRYLLPVVAILLTLFLLSRGASASVVISLLALAFTMPMVADWFSRETKIMLGPPAAAVGSYAVAAVFALLALITMGIKRPQPTLQQPETQQAQQQPVGQEPDMNHPDSIRHQLDREIAGAASHIERSSEWTSIDMLYIEVGLFNAWRTIAENGMARPEADIQQKGKALQKSVERIQQRVFPKLRKAYAQIQHDHFWENDITVKAKGAGSKTLEFVGYHFALNRNIKQVESDIEKDVSLFRFTRVQYLSNPYSEMQYYDYKTIPDGDPVVIRTK